VPRCRHIERGEVLPDGVPVEAARSYGSWRQVPGSFGGFCGVLRNFKNAKFRRQNKIYSNFIYKLS
jgi:hypothetical protein